MIMAPTLLLVWGLLCSYYAIINAGFLGGGGKFHAECKHASNIFVEENGPVIGRVSLTPLRQGVYVKYIRSHMNVTRTVKGIKAKVTVELAAGNTFKPFALDGLKMGNVCKAKEFATYMVYDRPYFDDPETCEWKPGFYKFKCPMDIDKVIKEKQDTQELVYGKYRVNITAEDDVGLTIFGYSFIVEIEKLDTYENRVQAQKQRHEARVKKTGHHGNARGQHKKNDKGSEEEDEDEDECPDM